MKSKLVSLFLSLLPIMTVAQEMSIGVKLENKTPDYISIREIYTAPYYYYEEPISDHYSGFINRSVVTLSEVHYSLYFERINIDIEGSCTELVFSKKADISIILDTYDLKSETTSIDRFCWKDYNTFSFFLGEIKVSGRLDNCNNNLLQLKITI